MKRASDLNRCFVLTVKEKIENNEDFWGMGENMIIWRRFYGIGCVRSLQLL